MDPILIEVPEVFETERLTLRIPRPGDGTEAHAAIVESQERLRAYIPWARPDITPEQEEIQARKRRSEFLGRECLWYYMFLKPGRAFVGMSGLHTIDWEVPRFEIGYWIRTRYEGQGYVGETVAGLTRIAFDLGAQRVEIRTDAANERSWRVAERAGFVFEGTLRNFCRDGNGVLGDMRVYSKIRMAA